MRCSQATPDSANRDPESETEREAHDPVEAPKATAPAPKIAALPIVFRRRIPPGFMPLHYQKRSSKPTRTIGELPIEDDPSNEVPRVSRVLVDLTCRKGYEGPLVFCIRNAVDTSARVVSVPVLPSKLLFAWHLSGNPLRRHHHP
jgi:hypothetical protein